MKRILSVVVLLLAVFSLSAQYSPCYYEKFNQGKTLYNQQKYNEAKQCFLTSKKCPDPNTSEANAWINKCNDKLNYLCYKEKCDAGESLYNKGDYAGAKKMFQSAKTDCHYTDTSRADEWIKKCDAKLNPPAPPVLSMPQTREYTVNGIAFKMVFVEGGTFTMGCTSEQGGDCIVDGTHQVILSDFWIGETEVTQALWMAVMDAEPTYYGGWMAEYGRGLTYPAYYVRWNDCQEFVQKLNTKLADHLLSGWKFALPTEAQWEYAARGGNSKNAYKYSGSNNIEEVAWYNENSYDKGKGNPGYGTHPVKRKKPNALGLYDMSGNVSEWCLDWYSTDYYSVSPSSNPVCLLSGSSRVVRGGNWCDDAGYCRVSRRNYEIPDHRYANFGFRLALVRQ